MQNEETEKKHLLVSEIATYFDVSKRAVGKWLAVGNIPAIIKKGPNNKQTRYVLLEDVKKYLLANSRNKHKTTLERCIADGGYEQ